MGHCKNCRFWVAINKSAPVRQGQCRRWPPVFVGEGYLDTPRADAEHFCGEYQRKP
jgi:hypothetical protein